MKMNPSIRARRILRSLHRFRNATDEVVRGYIDKIPIDTNETLLGVYENEERQVTRCIAATDHRILVEHDGSWMAAFYVDISGVNAPESYAITPRSAALRVQMKDGSTLLVSVCGQHERFFDVYAFCRFLLQVSWDASAEHRGA